MSAKNYVAVFVLVSFVMCAVGCIFDPRDPEPPDTGGGDCWIVPNTAKDVFLNLTCGLASIANSSYERSLAENFLFTPLDQDSIAFENALGYNVFANWTKEVEMDVITRFKGDFPGERSARFGDANGVFEREDVRVGEAQYEGLYMIVVDPGTGAPADTFSGKAIFYVYQSSKGWVLRRWEDVDVNGSYPTAGNLRGSLRSSS